MYGTLLDQRVFESLVEKTMPILWEHLVKADVQLSVVSLPWFLSLYINSMPLIFAFRVLDVFFLEGPKVLFQVGLAILRINGEELLDIADDGSFISILKNYFGSLDESAHPKSENEKVRGITKFQELMVVAFKEFGGITQSTISEQRSKHRDSVLEGIESFAKRTSIRNLGPESKKLSLDDLGFLYDRFYSILYDRHQRLQMIREESERNSRANKKTAAEFVSGVPSNRNIEVGRVGLGPSTNQMDYDGYRELLASITKWAITDSPSCSRQDTEKEGSIYSNHSGSSRKPSTSPWGSGPEPADHDFMQRLYGKWNRDDNDGLSLQDVVTGVAHIKGTRDIMTSLSYFFELYDDDKDGKVDREGILRISEALLFLTRRGFGSLANSPPQPAASSTTEDELDAKVSSPDERFLGSVSAFIRRCFEYADPDHPNNNEASSSLAQDMQKFAVGDSDSDNEEDLLDLDDGSSQPNQTTKSRSSQSVPGDNVSNGSQSNDSVPQSAHKANVALDPSRPLHITLPTFRMVILADELLQQFFESVFPNSFRLSSATPSMASNNSLTTFTSTVPLPEGNRTGGVVPPSKGLRGVLDNIVQDGMRVATEVRRRVDDVGREIERNALQRETEPEDDEPEHGDADRRSLKEGDRDLLEGAEAEAGVTVKQDEDLLGDLVEAKEPSSPQGSDFHGKVEFER